MNEAIHSGLAPYGPPSTVSIVRDEGVRDYPESPPFNPPEVYPEYPFESPTDEHNKVYSLVREALIQLGLDQGNIGTPEWNPFRGIVIPGTTVLIKPNLVNHRHEKGLAASSVVVHGSVIRPVIDYVHIALQGRGRIIVADTPLEKTDFDTLCRENGLAETVAYVATQSSIPTELIDLRAYRTFVHSGGRFSRVPISGDAVAALTVELGRDSALVDLDGENTNYHTLSDHSVDHYEPRTAQEGAPNRYHNTNTHQYRVAKQVLSADTVISVAKLKTHKKAGVTLNLKNMIGIVQGKEFIPHHRPGSSPIGDAFPSFPPRRYVVQRRFRQMVARFLALHLAVRSGVRFVVRNVMKLHLLSGEQPVEWGEWYGNDTIWRTILDVNSILLYADKTGTMQNMRQRRYFCLVDGVVGMGGEGPMAGEVVTPGIILAGSEPVATDAVAAGLMGFDVNRIKTISKAGEQRGHVLGTCDRKRITVLAKDESLRDLNLHFKPPLSWAGHLKV